MSKTIKTWRDPYDVGFSTTRAKEVTFDEGITILVGCNGSGKTTLINNIETVLQKEKTPFAKYDNLSDGGTSCLGEAFYSENYGLMASLFSSSEGENISTNMLRVLNKMKEFIDTGFYSTRQNRLSRIFKEDKEEQIKTKERWLLLDAVDSGYSIDNILDLKMLLNKLIEYSKKKGMQLYIIISCNEYEMASEESCMDVMSGKHMQFKDYNDFKKFILHTAELKQKREERLQKRRDKNADKEAITGNK